MTEYLSPFSYNKTEVRRWNVYYKLYIDSVFILQVACNLCLLSLAGKILKCTATHRRVWFGAVTGAVMACGMMLVPFGTIGLRMSVSAIPVSMCMLCVVFRICHGAKLVHASLVMAGCGFFLGSVMIWILNRLRTVLKGDVSLLIMLVTQYISYRILLKIIIAIRHKKESCLRTATVYVPALDRQLRIQAFIDTGNQLTEPVSGAPVCLISAKLAKQMESCFMPEKYHVIPFRSVGRDRGILDAYELPALTIEGQGHPVKKEHVIVAICNTGISEESICQMILHPRLFED